MEATVEEARRRAVEVLDRCSTPLGFRASALERGYSQMWARDAVITGLGALVSGEPRLVETYRRSLDSLAERQSRLGLVPLNIDSATGRVSTENAGAVDSNLWYILAHLLDFRATGDLQRLRLRLPSLSRALTWLNHQDMNECGLLEIPEAGNWMDLMAVRFNTLYDNVLYYAVWRAMDRILALCGEPEALEAEAERTAEAVNLLMWVEPAGPSAEVARRLELLTSRRFEWQLLYQNVAAISSRPHYLAYVAFRGFGDYCDSLGNLLAILFDVADATRADQILRFLYQVGIAVPFPTKALYPVVEPGHPDWREYYRSRNLNLPHQYHNGGIWPFIGGFHIAALVKMGRMMEARNLLGDLARACRTGAYEEWEFNEWLHGQTGNPMGYAYQGWSAGMYLYAYEAVRQERLPLLEGLFEA